MTRRPMLFIIAYDISNDRRRRKVANFLEERAARVQHSVFEARITLAQSRKLMQQLKAYCGKGDLIRIYAVPDSSLHYCLAHGGAEISQGGSYWLI